MPRSPIAIAPTDFARFVVLVSLLMIAAFARGRGAAAPAGATGIESNLQGLAMVSATEIVPEIVTVPPTTSAPTTTIASPTTAATTANLAAATTSTTTTTLPPAVPPTFESLARIDTIRDFTGFVSSGPARWARSVPEIESLRIVSTADGEEQPAWWLPPASDRDQPLLVILHSWSASYTQHAGIPLAMWAQENGWAVIAPQFRGVNNNSDAVGSDLAVQDAVDAIDYATAQDGVDADRVYVVGYSGGGMMGLLLAGRHPDKVTAVSAWGPPVDLVDFYSYSRARGLGYASDIRRACEGDPREAGAAQDECLSRSPRTYLNAARAQGVPIFIGQGIRDAFVSRSAGAQAFNLLADPEDRLSAEQVDLLRRGKIPVDPPDAITTETYFGDGDPQPVFARQSGAAVLVYFQAGHDMVYKASLRWFASDPRPAAIIPLT